MRGTRLTNNPYSSGAWNDRLATHFACAVAVEEPTKGSENPLMSTHLKSSLKYRRKGIITNAQRPLWWLFVTFTLHLN